MDPLWVGIIGIVVLLVFIGIGVPVFISMLLPGLLGLVYIIGFTGTSELVINQLFSYATRFEFTAVPMFLVMGYLSLEAGITSSAFDSARLWVSRLPGGLAMAACVASALFGACCGSGVSATAAMSRIAIPDMIRHNYDKKLAVGTVVSASTVAVLIPPSVVMVVYAIFAEVSLGGLLLAGYLPSILSIVLYMMMIGIRVRLNPQLAPSITGQITWRQRMEGLKRLWGIGVLAITLMGGIYSGFFTATEAAAMSALLSFIILVILGKFKKQIIKNAFVEAVKITSLSYSLLIGAAVYVVFINTTELPQTLTAIITKTQMPPYVLVSLVCIMFYILGCFLPAMSMLLISMPILLPVLINLDINLIWFGIIYVKMTEVAAITPPFGMGVFIIKAVLGDMISIEDIFRGVGWFMVIDILTLIILIALPQISLWLPNTMRGF